MRCGFRTGFGVVIFVVLLLGGCTKERAVALKTAADAFSAKAQQAIEAVVSLHLRSSVGVGVPDEAGYEKSAKDLVDTYKAKQDVGLVIDKAAFRWVDETERERKRSFQNYDDLKQSYAAFSAIYRRLPDAPAFGADAVQCSAALGARLVKHLVDAGKALADNPVSLTYDLEVSRLRLIDSTRAAADRGDTRALDKSVRDRVALLREQQQDNAEVIGKIVEAVQAGQETQDLIAKYGEISVEDLLLGVQRILEVREKTFGLSSARQLDILNDAMNRLQSDRALAAAAAQPLNTRPAQCQQGG